MATDQGVGGSNPLTHVKKIVRVVKTLTIFFNVPSFFEPGVRSPQRPLTHVILIVNISEYHKERGMRSKSRTHDQIVRSIKSNVTKRTTTYVGAWAVVLF